MSVLHEKVEHEALSLSGEERARLAEKLWESLGEGEPLSGAWLAEIDHRREEIRAGRAKPVPGADVSRKAWGMVQKSGV
jgi:putative addiction module component (TIGR02574 family)